MKSATESFFNDDCFFDQLFNDKTVNLQIEFQILDNDSELDVSVQLNNKVIVYKKCSHGSFTINEIITVDSIKNTLVIEIAKNNHSTFKLEKIIINNYDLIQDYDLFKSQVKFINNDTNTNQNVVDTFAFNASYKLEFTSPFVLWYQENTTKNVVISESMSFCATDQDLEYYQMAVDKVKKLIV
jgi:hypothetical protein